MTCGVCHQIVHRTDAPLHIFLVLRGSHLAYVIYIARVWPDFILAIHRPEEYDIASLNVAFLEMNTIHSILINCISCRRLLSCSALSRPYTTTSSTIPTQSGALARIRSMDSILYQYLDPEGCSGSCDILAGLIEVERKVSCVCAHL